MPSRHTDPEKSDGGHDSASAMPKESRGRTTTLLGLAVLVVGFLVVYLLFLRSSAPQGVVDFAPPSGNFTGTTTITTAYGYVCMASQITAVQTPPDFPTGTMTGVGMQCSPDLYGALQIPFGSGIVLAWLVTLLILAALIFYLLRWSPASINKPFSR